MMKTSRKFCATFILSLALAFSTFAGEIGFPGATNPPPQPDEQTAMAEETQFPGGISTGGVSSTSAAALDPVTEAALSLLRNLILFF